MMDRLPLVQALTAAGLERTGAEHVATALGQAIEASVATKRDLVDLRHELKGDIADLRHDMLRRLSDLRADLRGDMHSLEMRMLLRLGALNAAIAGILFAALRFGGHG